MSVVTFSLTLHISQQITITCMGFLTDLYNSTTCNATTSDVISVSPSTTIIPTTADVILTISSSPEHSGGGLTIGSGMNDFSGSGMNELADSISESTSSIHSSPSIPTITKIMTTTDNMLPYTTVTPTDIPRGRSNIYCNTT